MTNNRRILTERTPQTPGRYLGTVYNVSEGSKKKIFVYNYENHTTIHKTVVDHVTSRQDRHLWV